MKILRNRGILDSLDFRMLNMQLWPCDAFRGRYRNNNSLKERTQREMGRGVVDFLQVQ
jgi:hypothetical protein